MEKKWYAEGLSFSCTECGACCTGGPGYVWVSAEEIQIIADHLHLSLDTFSQKYLRKIGKRYSLIEKPKSYDCIFLSGKKCTIYEARPKQCKSYPFWDGILESRERWEQEKKNCEGISDEAPLITLATIEKKRKNE